MQWWDSWIWTWYIHGYKRDIFVDINVIYLWIWTETFTFSLCTDWVALTQYACYCKVKQNTTDGYKQNFQWVRRNCSGQSKRRSLEETRDSVPWGLTWGLTWGEGLCLLRKSNQLQCRSTNPLLFSAGNKKHSVPPSQGPQQEKSMHRESLGLRSSTRQEAPRDIIFGHPWKPPSEALPQLPALGKWDVTVTGADSLDSLVAKVKCVFERILQPQ